jgi:phenylacetate-coenzyme A ligase PaaK-like adenylate-forming protein
VVDDYGASEFLNIAYDCGCGSLHLNRDWVILEAVDREGLPVPDGTASDTALLTNLANFVQPIIRYDLGDSITFLTEPCPCGSSLPSIRVEGRRDDSIFLLRADGQPERVVPLALCTAIEERTGVYRFQVIEEAPNRLTLRIDPAEGDALEAGTRVAQCLHEYFAERGVSQISLRTDPQPPLRSAGGGKIRRVCARPDAAAEPAFGGPPGP